MRTVAAEWRIGKQPVEHAQDEIAVTIKVSAHLQYRDATISAGQRQKIRLGRNHRLGAGAPRYAFDGKRHLHLSRKRRDIILVQDRLYHRLNPHRPSALATRYRRSEERRVGKECVSTCRHWGAQDHTKKKKYNTCITIT